MAARPHRRLHPPLLRFLLLYFRSPALPWPLEHHSAQKFRMNRHLLDLTKRFSFGVNLDDYWRYAGTKAPKSIIIPHLLTVGLPDTSFRQDLGKTAGGFPSTESR